MTTTTLTRTQKGRSARNGLAYEGCGLLMRAITTVRKATGLTGGHVRLVRDFFKAMQHNPAITLAGFGRSQGLAKGHMSRIMGKARAVGLVERVGRTWFLRIDFLRQLVAGKAAAVIEHMREAARRVAERRALKLFGNSESVARCTTHTPFADTRTATDVRTLPDHPLKRAGGVVPARFRDLLRG